MEDNATPMGNLWQFAKPQGVAGGESSLSNPFAVGGGFTDSPAVRGPTVSRAMRRAARHNLDKSLSLLDQVVGSASTSPRNSPKQLRRAAASFMDTSSLAVNASSRHDDTMDTTITRTGVFDGTAASATLMLDEEPAMIGRDALFAEYAAAMDTHCTENQLLQLLAEFEAASGAHATSLRMLLHKVAPSHAKHGTVGAALADVAGEQHTWRLFAALHRDRLETELREHCVAPPTGQVETSSDKQLVEALYEADASVRQAQLVVDWLEANAADELASFSERVEFFSGECVGWENTLAALRAPGVCRGGEPMVRELDPDAPVRAGKPLAALDVEDEERLLAYVWACVRAGRLDQAQAVCARSGQAWRAATLEGWRLHNDPNLSGGSGPVEGNPYRDVWKAACWRMADDERLSVMERALYASLSGNVKVALPACATWWDAVWVYGRALLDTRVEQHLRIAGAATRAQHALPPKYWDKPMSIESIIREVAGSPYPRIAAEARGRWAALQTRLLVGDLGALLDACAEWARERDVTSHALRFLAHLVLAVCQTGAHGNKESCVLVLERYIASLVSSGRTSLVATFVAQLPTAVMQVERYAGFLETVSGTEARVEALRLAESAGLPVSRVTKAVVENVRMRHAAPAAFPLSAETPLDTNITPDDRVKISVLEWLTFDEGSRSEALRQGNAMMRTFLAAKKLQSARAVFTQIPPGSIDVVIKRWHVQTGATDLATDDDNAIREYLCHQAYLDAHDSFSDWFEHFHRRKPDDGGAPTAPGGGVTARVAEEQRRRQLDADVRRWQHSLQLQTDTTAARLYNVLLFVDGGWMVDVAGDSGDAGRRQQTACLRQQCLPATTFLLHTVLSGAGRHAECVRLADVVADDVGQLHGVFSRHQLRKLLQLVHISALQLLNDGKDPLGYDG